jgi:hypothetical protein
MKTIVPANPIKIYMRQNDLIDGEYMCSNVAFLILEETISRTGFCITFVTISGTAIPAHDVAFARVLIDGTWVSHD